VLEFRILGPLEIWRDGTQVVVAAPRERAFLAALILRPNRVVPADLLIDLLWGDTEPPPKARNTLHTWAWRLRRRLEPPPVLLSQPPGYLLRVEPDQIDLHRFEHLLHRGQTALTAGAPARTATLLREALVLWRGEPLADVAADRLRQLDGPRLAELYLQAVEARVDADLALGRHADLIGELRGLVAAHPLREGLHGHLMTALYGAGRQAEALDVYRALHRALDDQLGVAPGPAVQRLYQSLLRADEALDPRRPAAAPLRDGVTAAPAPTRAPAQLPADVSAFTGRTGYLRQLDELLADSQDGNAVVIAAVSGTAGVGKTALALHWAHRVRARFPDGQLYVNLRGYAPTAPMRPLEVLARFLRALGVGAEQVPLDVDEAADLYRTELADKRVLVVLDNARDPDQVRPLLPGTPGCLVLVTSRDRLGGLVAADGAQRVAVDVLTGPEARHLLTRTVGDPRVAADPDATDQLAEVCARLPLALRIAAANLAGHSHLAVADYLARLRADDRLTALAADGDDRTAVRAAFELSYQALPPAAQEVFRLIGMVPGPEVTADVIDAMAETAPTGAATISADRELDRLAAAHLVDEVSPGRYTSHDLLRRYATELAADGRTAGVERMLGHYLRTADAAARRLYPEKLRLARPAAVGDARFDDRVAALAWLDAERANLVAAVRYAAEHGPPDAAWLLADTLRGYFYLRMHAVDWVGVARAGLAAAHRAGDLRGQAAAHISLADLDWRHSLHQGAIDHYAQALAMCRETGWIEGEAAVLGNLGTVYWQAGQLDRSATQYRQALALNQRTGWLQGQAVNLCNIATVAWQRGRLAESAEVNADALALSRRIGSRGIEALALNNLGETYHQQGRLAEAVEHLEQARATHQEIGNRGSEGETVRCLAAAHRDAGRLDLAADLAAAALLLAEETGNHRHEIEALNTAASIDRNRDDVSRAADRHRRALALARSSNYRYAQADALIGLAVAEARLEHPGAAVTAARQAQRLASRDGYRILEGQALTVLARIHLTQGRAAAAVGEARAAVDAHEESGHRTGAARAHAVLADALAGLDDPTADLDAVVHRATADRIHAETGLWRPPPLPGTATTAAFSSWRSLY
jgi:DNA-binding SARP family transcriptional activator